MARLEFDLILKGRVASTAAGSPVGFDLIVGPTTMTVLFQDGRWQVLTLVGSRYVPHPVPGLRLEEGRASRVRVERGAVSLRLLVGDVEVLSLQHPARLISVRVRSFGYAVEVR